MSWLGVKYALACRDDRVKGGVRLVLVALGARVEFQRITTSPTSLSELQWLTFMSKEQLRRNLDFLEDVKKVRRLSRGKNAVYGLPEMAGPLFAVDDGDPVTMTDFVLAELPKEIGRNARKVSGRMTGFRRRMTDFAGVRAVADLLSGTEGTSTSTPLTPHDASFDRFWAAWPATRRVNKKKAREVWLRLKPDAQLVECIIAAVERQKLTSQWQEQDGKFIPHPERWLKGERWDDEIRVEPRVPRTGLRYAGAYDGPDPAGHVPPCRSRDECAERCRREKTA